MRLFAADAVVPGDLMYFKVLADDPGPLALRTDDGAEIKASVGTIGGYRVFAPESPIDEGTHVVLEYMVLCSGDLGHQLSTYAFTAGPASGPSDLSKGSLVLEEQGLDATRSFARIRFDPPGTDSASHLMDHYITIDGKALSSLAASYPSQFPIDVFTMCNPEQKGDVLDGCLHLYSVAAGKHVLRVSTAILGQAEQLEPLMLSVETSCAAFEGAADSGCSVHAPKTATDGASLALAGALAAVARLRRKRSPPL